MKNVLGFLWLEDLTEAPNAKEIKGGTFTSEENCCWKILPAFLILMRIAKPSSFFRAWTDQHPLMYIYVSSKSTIWSFFCLFDLSQMEKQLRFVPKLIFTSLQSKCLFSHFTSYFEDARHQIGIWHQNKCSGAKFDWASIGVRAYKHIYRKEEGRDVGGFFHHHHHNLPFNQITTT